MRPLHVGLIAAGVFVLALVVSAVALEGGARAVLSSLFGALALLAVVTGALVDRRRENAAPPTPPPAPSSPQKPDLYATRGPINESRLGDLEVTRVGRFTARRDK